MKMRALGRTGIQVSPYGLGTMMFGQAGNPDHDHCVRIIHRALDSGINFVDTADVYVPGGESEEIVGKALKGRRDDVVPVTKVNGSMGQDPNRGGGSRRWIVTEVEHSLRRLQTDHIDLYQIHHPDPQTDIEETLCALTDQRKLDAGEQLTPLAEEAGLSLTHLAMAFAITHPGATSAIIGPRTMEHREDLLAGAATTLDDEVLDRIDQIVAPGTDIGPLDVSYNPPAITRTTLRRRSADERAAVTR
ncbi:aldo/keto reductase [Streptomyces sp. NPDC048479]|uniref:aldo/keto reductase n=1 Tax=Streptomyces sp. NPDC048479 TaxID=3154725 RepID=UPI00341CDFD2